MAVPSNDIEVVYDTIQHYRVNSEFFSVHIKVTKFVIGCSDTICQVSSHIFCTWTSVVYILMNLTIFEAF